MLDVAFLVVVLRAGLGFIITAGLQAEHDFLGLYFNAHFRKAGAGLDVIAVLVLPVEQRVRAVVIGFVGHLECLAGAVVVTEVTVLVVQLEEIEEVVV